MHDTGLEERLRSVLRQEGDSLPFTITTDELERRLVLRRRGRNGQRLGLAAAGLAALAIGAIFAVGGWLGDRNVAGPSTDPSASPAQSPSPDASGSPAPASHVANPLGTARQAILVTPVGAMGIDDQRPEAFEVTRFDPETGESVLLATIPGSVIPDDGWLDADGPPQISATGYLAIPFTRGPNVDETEPAIAVIDTQAPNADPWILAGFTSMSWDEADKLVVERDGVVSVAWPSSRMLVPFDVHPSVRVAANGPGIASGPAVAVEDGVRFLATTTDDAATWGHLGFDGRFTTTDDLPPVYQRNGRERPAGAGAHGLGEACDSGATEAASGCVLVETDANHEPVATWLTLDGGPTLHDFAWGVDGNGVWMLLLGGGADADASTEALVYAQAPGATIELARVEMPQDLQPAILGITDEVSPGSAAVVAIGDDRGAARAFVLDGGRVVSRDVTAWFAGWAGDQAAYDPD